MTLACDVLVIGGGSAGSVIAARLSEDRNCRVILLESGPPDDSPLLPVPAAVAMITTSPRYVERVPTDAAPDMDGRSFFIPQGRVLGGGSSVNGMVWTRGLPSDFERWKAAGCEGWGYDDVLPLFRNMETHELGESRWHGGSGPLRISRGRSPLPICDAFLESTRDAGHAHVEDHSAGASEGFGPFDWSIGYGRRSSASASYLRPARDRANLIILTGARVDRLLFDGSRAVGCEFTRGTEKLIVRAEREVVLSAGALRSPQLLMLSGIGPAEHLREQGIEVRVDAPGVGQNFQNHISYKLEYTCSEPVTAYKYLNPVGAMGCGVEYLLFGTGMLAAAPTPIGGFLRSDPSLATPDFQTFLVPALVGSMERGTRGVLPTAHGFGIHVSQGTPFSRGEVRLSSIDPAKPPRVIPRYFSDPRDVEMMVRAVSMMREVVAQAPLKRLVDRELQPANEPQGREAWTAELRAKSSNFFHVAGTCRMGADASSVVDARLRVRGIDGLRVADASIMPTITNAQLNAPVIMIGEKAAALIRETA